MFDAIWSVVGPVLGVLGIISFLSLLVALVFFLFTFIVWSLQHGQKIISIIS